MSLDIKVGFTHSCSVHSLNEVVEGSKRDNKSLSLTIKTSEFSPYLECWRRDAKAIMFFSALLSTTVATFLSCTYLVAKPNLQDAVVFDLSKVYLLLTSLTGVTTFSSATPSEPWAVSIPSLIYALWLTSLVVSLSCTTFVVLLQRRVPRYLPMTRPSPRVYRGASIYTTQEQSLIVLQALFRGLRASLLMSNFLFLWGLGIQLLSAANPPSVLIVFGLSLTCFLGQYLILFAIQDFPSCSTEALSV